MFCYLKKSMKQWAQMITIAIQNGSIPQPRRTHIVPPGIRGAPPETHGVGSIYIFAQNHPSMGLFSDIQIIWNVVEKGTETLCILQRTCGGSKQSPPPWRAEITISLFRGCLHETASSFNPDRTHSVPVETTGDWIMFIHTNSYWVTTHSGLNSSNSGMKFPLGIT